MKRIQQVALACLFATGFSSPGMARATSVYQVKLIEINKKVEIAVDDLLQITKDDVKKSYPSGKIDKAYKLLDEITNKITGYEVHVIENGKVHVLMYDGDGKRPS